MTSPSLAKLFRRTDAVFSCSVVAPRADDVIENSFCLFNPVPNVLTHDKHTSVVLSMLFETLTIEAAEDLALVKIGIKKSVKFIFHLKAVHCMVNKILHV